MSDHWIARYLANRSWKERQQAREEGDNYIIDELFRPLLPLFEGANPLFVPCELASKKPSVNYAELTHDNWDAFYAEKLLDVGALGGNLAVKLGPISGDLFTIDLDFDELVEPFIELNPKLRETLRTKGQKGCQF